MANYTGEVQGYQLHSELHNVQLLCELTGARLARGGAARLKGRIVAYRGEQELQQIGVVTRHDAASGNRPTN